MKQKDKSGFKCPQPLRWAVMHFAESVRMVRELEKYASTERLCLYHYTEYLTIMESLLVEQVTTAFQDEAEIRAILTSAGFEDLVDEAVMLFEKDSK